MTTVSLVATNKTSQSQNQCVVSPAQAIVKGVVILVVSGFSDFSGV
jgi:hypothetical protein